MTTPSSGRGRYPPPNYLFLQSCPAHSSCDRFMPSFVRALVIFLSPFEGPISRITFPASEPGVCRPASQRRSSYQQKLKLVHEPAHADVVDDAERQKHE